MKQKVKNLLVKFNAALGCLLFACPQGVFAIGDGGMSDTLNTFQPVLDKVKPIANMFLSAVVFIAIIACIVMAVTKAVMMAKEEDARQKAELKKAFIGYLVATIVLFVAVPIINILLGVFGISVFNFA